MKHTEAFEKFLGRMWLRLLRADYTPLSEMKVSPDFKYVRYQGVEHYPENDETTGAGG